jgi:hypothetical protein
MGTLVENYPTLYRFLYNGQGIFLIDTIPEISPACCSITLQMIPERFFPAIFPFCILNGA